MKIFIEYADNYRAGDRIVAAASSLQSWYKRRHSELVKQHVELAFQATKETDLVKRAELDKQATETKEKLNQLNTGMARCRLANLSSNSEKVSFTSQIEKRLQLTTSPAPVIPDSKNNKSQQGRKKLTGVAAVYETWTDIGGYYEEKIARGAFRKVLAKNPDVRFLFNHDSNFIYGRTTNKSLRVYDTIQGLAFIWNDLLPNDPASDALFARVQGGLVTGCSFAFVIAEDDWILPANRGGLPKRTILEIEELFDIGPVVYPAYSTTSIQAVIERQKARGEILEEIYEKDKQEYDREHKLKELQKRAGLTFEQRFELGKNQRKAERLRNRLDAELKEIRN